MSQIGNEGTADVTNGSTTVDLSGVTVVGIVEAGHLFGIDAEGVHYQVASAPVSNAAVEITPAYNGVTRGGLDFWIQTSRTIYNKIPYPEANERDPHVVLKAAMVKIDSLFSDMGVAASITAKSFTATATGFSSTITGTAYYRKIGDTVVLDLPALAGTSNAATFTITGIPAEIRPANYKYFPVMVKDNTGTYQMGWMTINNSDTATLYITTSAAAANTWTSSGQKGVRAASLSYTLN